MTKKFPELIRLVIAATFFLTSCGTQDYASRDEDTSQQQPAPQVQKSGGAKDKKLLTKSDPQDGYFWAGATWVGVPDRDVTKLKCLLMDGSGVNKFQSFGAAILGGAVLGLVVKVSGSWFFGGPVESGPGHWFWNRIDKSIKTTGQGVVRGGLFGGVCQMILAGGSLVPFRGLLGQNFMALSSAVTLGGMTSIAAAPFLEKLIGKDWLRSDSAFSKFMNRRNVTKKVTDRIRNWSDSTDIGKDIIYRMVPGIFILGIGSGVGVVIYNWLHDDDPCNRDPAVAQSRPALQVPYDDSCPAECYDLQHPEKPSLNL